MVEGLLPQSQCPQCGAQASSADLPCWLCGASPVAAHATEGPIGLPPKAQPAPGQPFQFSIAGLLILITVIAVCLGALRVAPGLGILLAVISVVSAVPAGFRAAARASPGTPKPSFWASFFISAAAITVGIIAFGVSAFIGITVGCRGGSDSAANVLAMILIFGSPVVGLAASGVILWRTWPRRN
jgi:hypothetical protein